MIPPRLLPRSVSEFARRLRRQRTKRMTVVAGFVNREAVVLCADSREIIGDYSKKSTKKIRVYTKAGKFQVGIAGSADHTAYLDLFEFELSRNLGVLDRFDPEIFLSIIRATVHKIHKQHIWPQRWDRPAFNTLIAMQELGAERARCALVSTEATAVLPVREYKCIGVGQYLSDYLTSRMFPFDDDIALSPTERLVSAGVFIIREVKKAINGCDGETSIAVFENDGSFTFINKLEQTVIENWITSFTWADAKLFQTLLTPHTDDAAFGRKWATFKDEIEKLRKGQAFNADAFRSRPVKPELSELVPPTPSKAKRSASRKSKDQR
jgi:20S proteasome alpha/beta subunit